MNSTEYFQLKPKTSILFASNFGEGKTTQMIAFPRFFYIGFRQGGLSAINTLKNQKHKNNLIRYEELIPKDDKEMREFLEPEKGLLTRFVREAREMAQKNEIETLLLDDVTDAVENHQKYIWEFEYKKTGSGESDTQSMFGQLKINLSNVFDREILPFRKYGNIIIACHLMRESEQQLRGGSPDRKTGYKTRAGAVEPTSDIYPDIVGGFRREIQRKFENVIYLEAKLDQAGNRKFMAYCNKQVAFGTVILAKNVLNLPDKIDVTDKSLYDVLTSNINNGAKSPNT